jgi:hypothetical protein
VFNSDSTFALYLLLFGSSQPRQRSCLALLVV